MAFNNCTTACNYPCIVFLFWDVFPSFNPNITSSLKSFLTLDRSINQSLLNLEYN